MSARVKLTTVLALVLVLAGSLPAVAGAHPLGNFSVNHQARVSVSADRVEVLYLLDEAEIPTFRERGVPAAERLRRKQAEATTGLRLTVDGRTVALRPAGRARLALRPGEGGLKTTRFELSLAAPVDLPRRVEVRDDTFPGRVGWHAVIAEAGEGTAVRTDAAAEDPTDGLRRYPQDVLSSPAAVRVAAFDVRAGAGTLQTPDAPRSTDDGGGSGGRDPFAKLFSSAAAGDGVLLLLLVAAFGWGALHALSPGHGKAMVAAYLVGTRGTARDAVALGLIVTVTHTAGVVALGLIALTLSQYVLPEDLYPWLNLVSGLLVVVIGIAVLRSRRRGVELGHHHHHEPEPGGHHHAAHHHDVHHHDGHHHDGHHHDGHHHDGHHHDHHPPDRTGRRGLLAMGASAGLVPCPSALVVLLGAVAQHEIVLGLVLILAFSTGLAATLTGLGIAVVHAGRRLSGLPLPRGLVAAVPTVSALAIVAVGCLLTAQALPGVA